MVDDVIADAVAEIRRYLKDPVFREVYRGKRRTRILALVKAMEGVHDEMAREMVEDAKKHTKSHRSRTSLKK